MDDPGDCNFQIVSVLLHFIIIYIYIYYTHKYVSYTHSAGLSPGRAGDV